MLRIDDYSLEDFKTPLMRAAVNGHLDVVDRLIVHGVDVNAACAGTLFCLGWRGEGVGRGGGETHTEGDTEGEREGRAR